MMGAFLLGCFVGALGVLALTGLALWFLEWRDAWRGGSRFDDEITGAELDRAARRERDRE